MRALLLVILGLVVGAMGATFALSALRQGTPFHKGVMTVMQHHIGALRANVRAKQCNATSSATQLDRLTTAAADIPEAFPDMDAGFRTDTAALATALDHARTGLADGSCQALARALQPVEQACRACHQQYR